jgi:hypothetical protein
MVAGSPDTPALWLGQAGYFPASEFGSAPIFLQVRGASTSFEVTLLIVFAVGARADDCTSLAKAHGNWRSMPFFAERQLAVVGAASKEADQSSDSCQELAGEPIDGETTSPFVIHGGADGKVTDFRLWISDKSGGH